MGQFLRFFQTPDRSLIVGTIKMLDSDWNIRDFLHENFFKLMKSDRLSPPKDCAKPMNDFKRSVERSKTRADFEEKNGSDEEWNPEAPIRVRKRRRSKTR